MLALVALVAAYLLVFFHWALPRFGEHAWVDPLAMVINVSIIGVADLILGRYGVGLEMLYAIVVGMAGITSGPRKAVVAGAAGRDLRGAVGRDQPTGRSRRLLLSLFLHLAGFLVLGLGSGFMADAIRRQSLETVGRNRELALLLDANRTVTASLNLYETLPILAEKIAHGLPATFCRICLVDAKHGHLITYGVHPIRPLDGWHACPRQTLRPGRSCRGIWRRSRPRSR